MPIHMGGVSLVYQKLSRLVVGFAVTFLLCAMPLPAMAQRGMTVTFLTDPDASLRIEDAVSPEQAGSYQVYVPSFMAFSRLPDDFNGAIWLRMVFGSSFEKPVGQLVANFGASLPGITQLYIPAQDGGFTLMESAPSSGIFALPENMPFPDILYARFDGTPGLWFRPVLEAASGSPDAFPRHLALAGIFAFAMLALLIQYIRKGEQWRIWAALTTGCGIIASLLPATPTAGAAYTPLMAAAMLMPGLILVFFIHSARHLFNAPKTMPNYDKLFIIYYFLGGLIALLPLVPGFLWFARYLPLVGIALALLLPAAMVAMALSLKGAPVFFCACLLPVVGVAASAWELTATKSPLVGGSGGLFGLAFGLVVWSFFGQVRYEEEKRADDDVFASLDRSLSTENAEALQDAAPQTSASSGPDTLIPQEVSSRQEAGRAALSDDAGAPPLRQCLCRHRKAWRWRVGRHVIRCGQ
ncbi:hypothetical protein FACS1894168_3870 [Deltaproteobacteria bacterium]|nr:hypothetical protein FACS1894168_3870 [Deltaproteobacteria bacterium]